MTTETLLTEQQAADLLNFSPRFLQSRRIRGDGPKYVRISGRAIRYRLTDIRAWIEGRIECSTAEMKQ